MIDMSNLYKINSDDHIFVDTNILIFLFSPSFVNTQKYQVDKYASIYAKMIQENCSLYVNQMVISEFINRCMRIDFARNFNSTGDKDYKKDYRPSSEYKSTLKIVLNQLKKILKNVQPINDDFESFDVFSAYHEYENDFNDLIIAHTVENMSLKLLSDDKDFQDSLGINTEWYL